MIKNLQVSSKEKYFDSSTKVSVIRTKKVLFSYLNLFGMAIIGTRAHILVVPAISIRFRMADPPSYPTKHF